MPNMHDYTILYHEDDSGEIEPFLNKLKGSDITVWYDKENKVYGQNSTDTIKDSLLNSNGCLIFFRFYDKPWECHHGAEQIEELLIEKSKDKNFRIIPVILPKFNTKIPEYLNFTQMDVKNGIYNSFDLEQFIKKHKEGNIVNTFKENPNSKFDSSMFSSFPRGFRADVDKIVTLLVGESLYSQKDVSIRELIQNSIDACIRRKGWFAKKISININTKENFFEVSDNGDGMNLNSLQDSFSIIGKSIQGDNVLEGALDSNDEREKLIGKFGIGFISTLMISEKIQISTRHENSNQINLEITGIPNEFDYYENSQIGRNPREVGTKVRVYIKKEFQNIDILNSIMKYCRHILHLEVFEDDKKIKLDDSWNTEEAIEAQKYYLDNKCEVSLGIFKEARNIILSNEGFYIKSINKYSFILPTHLPSYIGGEINFTSSAVSLNIARDDIINNEKLIFLKSFITFRVRDLILDTLQNKNQKANKTTLNLLKYYLYLAIENEEKDLPFSAEEASDLLYSNWFFRIGIDLSLLDIVNRLKNKKYLYYTNEDNDSLQSVNLLEQEGYTVIRITSRDIDLKKQYAKKRIEEKKILIYLAERFGFEVVSVATPREEDMRAINEGIINIPDKWKKLIRGIPDELGEDVSLVSCSFKDLSFKFSDKIYINLNSDELSKYFNEGITSDGLKYFLKGHLSKK